MQTKVKVSAVSYLNTKPFLYGLDNSPLKEDIELSLDIPSVCAKKLQSGEADIGLVPVAVIPELNNPQIISRFCIGADGPVKTVCIYSQVPLQEVEELYLDYQSRTSVEVAKILLKEYWRIAPRLKAASKGYEKKISGSTAGLVIGDRAIHLGQKFPYRYDLSEAWKQMTGLPFVFAAWVAVRPLPQSFLNQFNEAMQAGIANIHIVAEEYKNNFPAGFNVEEYLSKNIQYELDEARQKGLTLFLSKLKEEIHI